MTTSREAGSTGSDRLANVGAFVFDVDGTLILSDDPNSGGGGVTPLPGAADVLQALRAARRPLACFTNGTGQLPGALAAKLRSVGLDVADSEMLTPSVVAAEYIGRRYAHQPVLAFGNAGVLEPLRAAGVELLHLTEAQRAAVVLVGADPEFTYAKLEAACGAVWNGAALLVTSMAPFFAGRGGRMPSTSGAIAAGIKHVTGAEPIVVGKPSPLVIEVLARRLGVAATRLGVIGDDVRLEIRMAHQAGAVSILVLTGATRQQEIVDLAPDEQPDLILAAVGDLLDHLR